MPSSEPSGLMRVSRAERLRLSYGQQRLWFIDRMSPGSPLYNEPLVVLELKGALDVEAVRRAMDHLLSRHEVLRTVIQETAGEPAARILEPRPAQLELLDLRDASRERTEERLEALLAEESTRSFDLARGPLIRFCLARTAQERHVLVVASHHVVSDGWSVRVLLRELAALYADALRKRPLGALLPALDIQYADYAAWQRGRLEQGALAGEERYWLSRLRGAPLRLDWPTDRERPRVSRLDGAYVSARLDTRSVDRLRAEASAALRDDAGPITRFMVLLAAWVLILHRRAGSLDICVGSAVAGRVRKELEPLIGFFVNVLVLRTDLTGNPTLATLLARVRETVLGALEHQELPFDRLVEQLQPERRDSHQPLVNVFFAYHNFSAEHHVVEGLELRRLRYERGGAKYDVALLAVESEEDAEHLTLQLWYDPELYDEGTMRDALDEVVRAVEGLGSRQLGQRLMALDAVLEPAEDGPGEAQFRW
ncbi:condensation domain-containing protein [Myxococcus sp. K38C18041901]|uniref:condensation domain-containing protein n=1 Tax=Myxococcus guangdongensis TaxID=2906760 RepID=UPI0020A8064F|nr:condensation domain-containing protein [Myxococcus guangdongensis]MCP3059807.1 condensation domain-containing protein [Myxococcus guangdongensis]